MKKSLLIAFTLALITTTALAQEKTPPPPGAARPLNLPKITEKKLANGLTVVLAPLPNVPKVTSVLTFRDNCKRSQGTSRHRADCSRGSE
jgi:hypothetical protein